MCVSIIIKYFGLIKVYKGTFEGFNEMFGNPGIVVHLIFIFLKLGIGT